MRSRTGEPDEQLQNPTPSRSPILRENGRSLQQRLNAINSETNCWDALGLAPVIDELKAKANGVLFLNAAGWESTITLNDAIGAGGGQTIRGFVRNAPWEQAAITLTVNGRATDVVVLRDAFFYTRNSDGKVSGVTTEWQRQNVLLHELLHTFLPTLGHPDIEQHFKTGGKNLLQWLADDCK